jgi:hypothetical protein
MVYVVFPPDLKVENHRIKTFFGQAAFFKRTKNFFSERTKNFFDPT